MKHFFKNFLSLVLSLCLLLSSFAGLTAYAAEAGNETGSGSYNRSETMFVGERKFLKGIWTFDTVLYVNVLYDTNGGVISVPEKSGNGAYITAKKPGTATVKIVIDSYDSIYTPPTAQDTTVFTVTVSDETVSIEPSVKSTTLEKSKSYYSEITVTPESAVNGISVSSSDTNVVTVKKNDDYSSTWHTMTISMKPVNIGEAVITISHTSGVSASFNVKVINTAQNVYFQQSEISVKKGGSVSLYVSTSPSDADGFTVESDNPSIAKAYSQGRTVIIQGVSAGETIIRAIAPNNTSECKVTVNDEGDYEYEVLSDGTAEITKFLDSGSEAIIPSEIDGYKITSIGRGAFSSRTSLTNVIIPDSITIIHRNAFWCCKGLTNLTLGQNVVVIEEGAFFYCESLREVIIPDSVTSIGKEAFKYCNSVTNIILGDGLTTIEESVFYNCTSLKSVTIGKAVNNIARDAFYGNQNIESINIKDIAAWCAITDKDSNLKGSGYNLYFNNELVTDLVIPDDITTIKEIAFKNCRSLTSVTVPESVESIEAHAFSGCYNLSSAFIGSTVIEPYAFAGCYLKKIKIGSNTSTIYANSFDYDHVSTIEVDSENTHYTSENDVLFDKAKTQIIKYYCRKGINEYTIPDTVTSIGPLAFENCILSSVNIPNSVTNIGNSSFIRCRRLTGVTIGNSVTSIGNYAFRSCESLESVTIPDSVTSIGDEAFEDCTSLASVTIPSSVTSIGRYAFFRCTNLKSVYINDIEAWCNISFFDSTSNPLINESKLYLNGELVTDLIIPDSVTSIGNYVFSEYTSLASVTIPDSVTSIGYHAFAYSNLYQVVIGNSVETIDGYPFCGCENLVSVTLGKEVRSIGGYAFSDCTSLSHVFFNASEITKGYISIDKGNSTLKKATWHYDTMEKVIFSDKTVNPTCVEKGYTYLVCPICNKECGKGNYVDAPGHDISNGICSRCGKPDDECIESVHPYHKGEYQSWIIHKDGAVGISATFSKDTYTGSDYIYVYGKNDKWRYNGKGTAFADYPIYLQDDTIKITLRSDVGGGYGFKITDVHYCMRDSLEVKTVIPPSCSAHGYTVYRCPDCQREYNFDYTEGHNFEDGTCTECGIKDIDYAQSDHSYSNNRDESWTIYRAESKRVSITFSQDTRTEKDCDFIFIYDKDGNEYGKYSGTELAGKTVTVEGDTVRIRLTSDRSTISYGFSLTDITAVYIDPEPEYAMGDIDGDGEITVKDATEIMKFTVNLTVLTAEQLALADVDGDGEVTVKDATEVMKHTVNLTSVLDTA